MGPKEQARSRFEQWLEQRVVDGEAPDPASLCADRPELLPALRSLIERYQDLDEVLPSPTRTVAADADLAAQTLDLEPPVVDNHRIISLLGMGGMGEAWQAEQQSPVRRPVALKVIRRGSNTAQVVSRFAAERQALAAMEHSAIAKVFDAGATEDGRPYFAMELVRGEPIDRFADQQRLTIRQRLELFADVCDGVQHAHQKGLIHRDLKPSNILVSLRDDGTSEAGDHRFEPKIIDFGIAKAIAPQTGDQDTLTVLGQVVGTPAYMSPEQANLASHEIDTRSDVYALGIVLYQLLVGVLPFGSGTVLRMERPTDPPVPSARLMMLGARGAPVAAGRHTEVNGIARQLRGEIDWVVMKALAHEREERYASPAALAEDLRRSFRNEPLSAGPPSVTYRLRKLARRHRVAVAVAVTVLLAVITALGGLGIGLQRALRAEARATADSKVARRVTDFLVDAFRAGDPNLSGAPVAARDIVGQAAIRIRQQLAEEPQIQARLTSVLAEASLNLGELEQALSLAADGARLSATNRGEDDPETVDARSLEAFILMTAGRLDEAEARFRALLDTESSRRPGGLLEARIANDLGILLQSREQYEASENLLRRALAIYRATGTETERDAIRTLHNLAYSRRHQGETAEAADILREVLALQHEILTPPSTDIASTLNDLASAIRKLGDLEEAESLYRQALAQRRAILSPEHPDVAQSLNNIGSVRSWGGDYEQAGIYFKQAYDVWQATYNGDHPRLCASLTNLGSVSRRSGRLDRAEDYYLQALAMEERLHGLDHVRVATALRRVGDTQIAAGRPRDAITTLERSVDLFARHHGRDHAHSVTATISLAAAYRGGGKPAEAERLLRRLESTVADDSEQVARVREARQPS